MVEYQDDQAVGVKAIKDTFIFCDRDSGLPSATTFDTITDFAMGIDIIDDDDDLQVSENIPATSGIAAINAEGIASFHDDDSTLELKLIAAAAGTEVDTGGAEWGNFAIFEHGNDSYVFISDTTDGVNANDGFIKLVGVTGLTDSTIDANDDLLIA